MARLKIGKGSIKNKVKVKLPEPTPIVAPAIAVPEAFIAPEPTVQIITQKEFIYTDRPVETIVEKIVYVDVIKEVPVEVIVEKTVYVEVPKETIIEKTVEIEVIKEIVNNEKVDKLEKSLKNIKLAFAITSIALLVLGVLV